MEVPKLSFEVRWKGPKFALTSFKFSGKGNFTVEKKITNDNGVVELNEISQSVCNHLDLDYPFGEFYWFRSFYLIGFPPLFGVTLFCVSLA